MYDALKVVDQRRLELLVFDIVELGNLVRS